MTGSSGRARDVALIIGASLFVALMAQLVIRLPFTPVPITGQTLAVLLTGAALGSWRGGAALLLYLIEGSFLPFYAGGASGLVWTLASGGYIIGFILAAFVVGFLSERGWDRSVWIIVAMLAGNVVLYVPGLIQLSYFVPEGKVLEFGLLSLYPRRPGKAVHRIAGPPYRLGGGQPLSTAICSLVPYNGSGVVASPGFQHGQRYL